MSTVEIKSAFFPSGSHCPHRLNAICLGLKDKLEAERATEVGNKVSLTAIAFAPARDTGAQRFDKALSKSTTNAQIDAATAFGETDQQRLDEITTALSAGAAAAADVTAFARWADTLATECTAVAAAFLDEPLEKLTGVRAAATAAREAATVAAGALFTDEPLPGVGSETWRSLWAAARDYSLKEAYVGKPFPVVATDAEPAACVLCQQPLLPDGVSRMQRFQKYMDDTLDAAATKAEQAVADALGKLHELVCCVSAWNKDPVFGVIGIQSGPRGKGPQWLPSSHGSRGWNAGGGDDCQDPSRLFC